MASTRHQDMAMHCDRYQSDSVVLQRTRSHLTMPVKVDRWKPRPPVLACSHPASCSISSVPSYMMHRAGKQGPPSPAGGGRRPPPPETLPERPPQAPEPHPRPFCLAAPARDPEEKGPSRLQRPASWACWGWACRQPLPAFSVTPPAAPHVQLRKAPHVQLRKAPHVQLRKAPTCS